MNKNESKKNNEHNNDDAKHAEKDEQKNAANAQGEAGVLDADAKGDLKAQIEKLKSANAKLIEQVLSAENKVMKLEEELNKNLRDFHDKAKDFSSKAQAELNKHRAALDEKLEGEKLHLKKYGSQRMLEDILEPLINIQLAVAAGAQVEGAVSNYVIGFKMLLDQINDGLSKHWVTLINPAPGSHFNPAEHEAIGKERRDEADLIIEVKKLGYKLHDRVIKPAKVVISEAHKKSH